MRALALIVLLVVPVVAESATINAADCNYASVNTALTAAVDGDVVVVPAGSCTWTSLLVWSNKSITLKGAGVGKTIIDVDNLNGTYPCMIDLTLKPTGNTPAGFTRITGFTFRATQHCGDDVPNTPDGMIHVRGDSPNFRFDHNRVESNTVAGGVVFMGYVRGVVDHNFVTSLVSATLNRKSFVCWHDSWANVGTHGNASWANPSTVGTVDQIIFEDNTFDRTGAPNGLNAFNDDYGGCRATYRFNTLNNAHAATHGTETSQDIRAVRHVEYYRNHTTTHPLGQDSVIKYRDGSGMTFDNTTSPNMATVRFGALATLRREDDGSHPGGWFPWKSCGDHGTPISVTRSGSTATFVMPQNHYVPTNGAWVLVSGYNQAEYNGTFFAARVDATTFTVQVTGAPATPATGVGIVRAPFDGNTDAAGYPCLDQVGRGAGQLYTGTGASKTPIITANQVAQPVYCWNNSVAGTARGCSAIYGEDVIVENREFYNLNASFDGTTGIGRGLRSSRPSTCTTGVAYWSTDGGGNWNASTTETFSSVPGEDGGLDLCSATNTWTNDWYVPPTYPHVLAVDDVVQHYVSPSGSAAWSACVVSSTPCSVATAMSSAVAGDVVRFLSGEYFPPAAPNYYQPSWYPANDGVEGLPITLISDVRHGAIIRDAANADGPEGRCGFGAFQNSWVVFDGFLVAPHLTPQTAVRYPFTVDSSNDIHVQNFAMVGWEHADHTNASMIGVYGQTSESFNVYIHHNDISGVATDLTPTEAVVNASAIYIFEAHHVYVYNNTIHDSNNGVAWKTVPNDIHVYRNYLYNISRAAFFPTIEVSTGNANHFVHHNVCRNCNILLDAEESPAGGGTWSNLQVYNNTLYNDASHPFGLINTFPSGTANVSGMIAGQSGGPQTLRGLQFYNNIVVVNTTSRGWEIHDSTTSDALIGVPFDYNVYYVSSGTLRYIYNGTNTTTFGTWASAIGDDGEEANSSTANPVFLNGSGNLNMVNDFQLNPASSPFVSNGYGGVQRGAFEGGGCIGAECSSALLPVLRRFAPMFTIRRSS